MDRRRARTIADALAWARAWSALPITALAWCGLRWWAFGLYYAARLAPVEL